MTVLIDHEVHEGWTSWMINDHIPEIMDTHCFESWKISKVLGADESQGINYAVQFVAPSMQKFEEYSDLHLQRFQEEHTRMYREKYVAFRTLLETIYEGRNDLANR